MDAHPHTTTRTHHPLRESAHGAKKGVLASATGGLRLLPRHCRKAKMSLSRTKKLVVWMVILATPVRSERAVLGSSSTHFFSFLSFFLGETCLRQNDVPALWQAHLPSPSAAATRRCIAFRSNEYEWVSNLSENAQSSNLLSV